MAGSWSVIKDPNDGTDLIIATKVPHPEITPISEVYERDGWNSDDLHDADF